MKNVFYFWICMAVWLLSACSSQKKGDGEDVQTYDEISACDGSYGVLKEDEFIKEFMNQKNIQ